MKKEKLISKCCSASVRAEGIGDFDNKDKICTIYYVCEACKNPCDIIRDKFLCK